MIGTVTIGDTPVDVYGTELPSEPDVGIMGNYVEIEDLEVGGISIYEMVANNPIFEQIQEAINDMVNEWKHFLQHTEITMKVFPMIARAWICVITLQLKLCKA